jgi:hypothetical protein
MVFFKNIILVFIFTLSTSAISAQENQVKTLEFEIITLKRDGWKSLTTGVLTHLVGSISTLSHDNLQNKDVRAGFIITNSVGLGLDLMSFTKFYKARKKQKILNSIKQTSCPSYI